MFTANLMKFAFLTVVLVASTAAIAYPKQHHVPKLFPPFHTGGSPKLVHAPGNELLPDCDTIKPKPGKATRVFKLTLAQPLNIYDLQFKLAEHDADGAGVDEDNSKPDESGTLADNPTTKMDIDLHLAKIPGAKKHQVGLIKIILDKPPAGIKSATFRGDGYAIAASDPNGKVMFCSIKSVTYNPNVVIFKVFYYDKNPGPDNSTRGGFNIGIMIPNSGGLTLPIFIDPEVKNNG